MVWIGTPERSEGGVILAASLPVLLANKPKVIHDRLEKKVSPNLEGACGLEGMVRCEP